jgi:hypothetical protein
VAFQGLVVRKTTLVEEVYVQEFVARGFFLLPELPTQGQALSAMPKQSGRVEIQRLKIQN